MFMSVKISLHEVVAKSYFEDYAWIFFLVFSLLFLCGIITYLWIGSRLMPTLYSSANNIELFITRGTQGLPNDCRSDFTRSRKIIELTNKLCSLHKSNWWWYSHGLNSGTLRVVYLAYCVQTRLSRIVTFFLRNKPATEIFNLHIFCVWSVRV